MAVLSYIRFQLTREKSHLGEQEKQSCNIHAHKLMKAQISLHIYTRAFKEMCCGHESEEKQGLESQESTAGSGIEERPDNEEWKGNRGEGQKKKTRGSTGRP